MRKHLKLTLVKESAEIEAIAFNIDVDAWIEDPPSRFTPCFASMSTSTGRPRRCSW